MNDHLYPRSGRRTAGPRTRVDRAVYYTDGKARTHFALIHSDGTPSLARGGRGDRVRPGVQRVTPRTDLPESPFEQRGRAGPRRARGIREVPGR